MGYKQRRKVLAMVELEIKGLPWQVAKEIAIEADEATGLCNGLTLERLAQLTHATEGSVSDALTELSQEGWEFRVPLGTDKNGKPQYAVRGKATVYRVPAGRGPHRETDKTRKRRGEKPKAPVTTGPLNGSYGPVTTGESPVVTGESPVTTGPLLLPSTSFDVTTNPPAGDLSSLSPTATRGNDEREKIIIRLAKEHHAAVDEIEGAWKTASDSDFNEGRDGGYWVHLEAWAKRPDKVAEDLADYRQKRSWDAERAQQQTAGAATRAARAHCEFHALPKPCRGCIADAKAADYTWQQARTTAAAPFEYEPYPGCEQHAACTGCEDCGGCLVRGALSHICRPAAPDRHGCGECARPVDDGGANCPQCRKQLAAVFGPELPISEPFGIFAANGTTLHRSSDADQETP